MIINLKNSEGILKPVKVGFSRMNLFFGGFLPLFRKDWKQALIQFVCAMLTHGLTLLVFPFFYNNLNIAFMLQNGYVAADENAEFDLKKIEAEKALWYKRPKIMIGGLVGIACLMLFLSVFLTSTRNTGGFADRMAAVSVADVKKSNAVGTNSETASQIIANSTPKPAPSNVVQVAASKSPLRGKWLYKAQGGALSAVLVANGANGDNTLDISLATKNFKGQTEATGQIINANNGTMYFSFTEKNGKSGNGTIHMQGDKLFLDLQQDVHGGFVSGQYTLDRWVD